jgi:hypothetical protein
MRRVSLTIGCATLLALLVYALGAQQAGAPGAGQAGRAGGRGMPSPVPVTNDEPVPRIPVGFTSISTEKT